MLISSHLNSMGADFVASKPKNPQEEALTTVLLIFNAL